MRMLRLWCAHCAYGVRNWWALWACASGTDVHPDHTHHFLTHTLSMHISFPKFSFCIHSAGNWCVHWACVSGTDAYAEQTHQFRNWCMHWANASGTNVCTECSPSKHAEHKHQELMRTMSIRRKNWCVCWAYESGTDAYPLKCTFAIKINFTKPKFFLDWKAKWIPKG
jgi:plasmid maintenance system killer protein